MGKMATVLQKYDAEGEGYLSLLQGQRVKLEIAQPMAGNEGTDSWPQYVWGHRIPVGAAGEVRTSTELERGWFPYDDQFLRSDD
jgi:hypothetical protein